MSTEKQNSFNDIIFKPSVDKPWYEYNFDPKSNSKRIIDLISSGTNLSLLNLSNSEIIFRGESDVSFKLEPRLCRIAKKMPPKQKLKYEFDSLKYFQQRAPDYLPAHYLPPDNLPSHTSYFEWLAIMQHYGAPTRLLDWTTSVNVAFYFAVHESHQKNGCIWMLWKKSFDASIPEYPYDVENLETFAENRNNFVEFGNETTEIIEIFDSIIKTDRMVAQNGLFTYCHHQEAHHAKIITNQLKTAYGEKTLSDPQKILLRFIIPYKIKKDIREYLSKIGITASTLFPGIDGLGRTVTEMFTVHDETLNWPQS